MKRIYLDNAATTRVAPEVLEAMRPCFTDNYGNPSSLHSWGQEAKQALEDSRRKVARVINAEPGEIVFTSGGSESDNLAIKGIALRKGKGHIITSKTEHHAVLETCGFLKRSGFDLTILPVDGEGFVNPSDLEKAMRPDTILVSIMHANNEIGTIQPVRELGKICRDRDVPFHTDAVQSFGKIPIDVKNMNIDLLSVSAHKIHGPKGAGALYVRSGTELLAQIHGGGHESGLRSGTENIPGIVGFAKACGLVKINDDNMIGLRNKLIQGVLEIKDSRLNGPNPLGGDDRRLPNNANFGFRYIEGESLVLRLDDMGIAASTGSACSSKSLRPSHVLTGIGLSPADAHGSLRLTLSRYTTREEIDYVLSVLPGIVEDLRRISPLGADKE